MKKYFLLLMLSGGTLIANAQEWKSTGDNSTTGKVTAKEYTFPHVYYDLSKEPRTQIGSMSIKLFDDYASQRPGGSSPDNNSYGTLIAMYGRVNHWESNIYFGASTKKMYFRTSTWSGGTSENGTTGGFHDWRTLLDNKSDVKSSGLLKMEGSGTHYFSKGNVGIGVTETKGRLHVNGSIYANMGEGFKIYGDANYFGEYLDAIIFQMEDSNSSNGNTDGGFVFRGFTPKDGKFKDWMTIKREGKVGIGTLTPSENLTVYGTSARLSITGESGSSAIIMGNQNSGGVNNPSAIWSANGNLFFGGGTSWNRGGTLSSNMIVADNGNVGVGVGTSSPRSKFYVKKGVSGGTSHGFSTLTVEGASNEMISILTPNNKTAYFGFSDSDDDYVGGMQYEHANDRLIFRSNNHNADMVIDKNGNVGIGTTDTQGFKLGVNGRIAATEVKVAKYEHWADFVFEEDYDLPTLKEVEKHIEEKGHLENIPSAEEVKKDGFFLGEMDAKLLRKIEELMLYTIEQEKELKKQEVRAKSQQEKMKQLEKENVVLKNRLDKIEELLKKLKNN